MKNYFASLLLISSLVGFTQIKTGTYKSSSKNGDILLRINEDKTYEMSFFTENMLFQKTQFCLIVIKLIQVFLV